MIEGVEIKGGAGPFEAAVIAVVLDRISEDENRGQTPSGSDLTLTPWMRAVLDDEPDWPGWVEPAPS
jgi:hypothetical protein